MHDNHIWWDKWLIISSCSTCHPRAMVPWNTLPQWKTSGELSGYRPSISRGDIMPNDTRNRERGSTRTSIGDMLMGGNYVLNSDEKTISDTYDNFSWWSPQIHYAPFVLRWSENVKEFVVAALQVPFFTDMMIKFSENVFIICKYNPQIDQNRITILSACT